MIQAKILWYDHRDGYGIAKTAEGVEYYIDDSVLKCEKESLKRKVEVTFEHNLSIKDCRCGKNVKLQQRAEVLKK